MDVKNISSNLKLHDGIWISKKTTPVSYPESGNSDCLQIENDSFWFNHRNECIVSTINNYKPNGMILDIGGGNGFVSQQLMKSGYPVGLVEPGLDGIINAKKRGITTLINSSFEDAFFLPNSIPAIGVFDVIEHIEHDELFLHSVSESLIENGYLYITVPAYNSLWSAEDDYAGHFRRYTLRTLKDKLLDNNFEVKYETYFFSILPLPIFIFRSLPTKFGKVGNLEKEKINQKEHQSRSGLVGSLLDKVWNFELNRIRKKKQIPIGSSCLVVAKKK